MVVARNEIGRLGEDVAVRHLERAGLRVLERNWRCRVGEIDVVAMDGDCLVVCEVKTRRSVSAGSPVEAVTAVKLRRLRRLTGIWLAHQDRRFTAIRIDVIGVRVTGGEMLVEQHLRAVG
jgi:putative endonuclease